MTDKQSPLLIVTGASGGLGSAIVTCGLDRSMRVIALTRKPYHSDGASSVVFDLADQSGVEGTVSSLLELIEDSGAQRIAFIANAACIGPRGLPVGDSSSTESFTVNCLSQMAIIEKLALQLPSLNFDLWCVSSGMGSIAMVAAGDRYVYAASKASLNIIGRLVEKNRSNVKAVSVNPGWMRTRLGGLDAPLSPVEVASKFVDRIVQGAESQTGRHDGIISLLDGGISPW